MLLDSMWLCNKTLSIVAYLLFSETAKVLFFFLIVNGSEKIVCFVGGRLGQTVDTVLCSHDFIFQLRRIFFILFEQLGSSTFDNG